MNDFETMPRGTTQEISLSRDLVEKIIQNIETYGRGIFPYDVLKSFDTLCKFYETQLESENYE
jgi:hypothetical protein